MKKNLKRALALVLALAMLAMTACSGGGDTPGTAAPDGDAEATSAAADNAEGNTGAGAESQAPAASSTSKTPADTLVVGVTDMNGDFVAGFGNSAYDLSIKTILHGSCDVVHVDANDQLVVSETNVVKSYEVTDNADGSRTYTFTLFDDLKWSNGDPITAKDYIACLLAWASPEWVKAGASSNLGQGLVGYMDYYNGYKTDEDGLAVNAAGETIEVQTEEVDADGNPVTDEDGNPVIKSNLDEIQDQIVPVKNFAGAALVDEYTFSLTIDPEELPYFYEMVYVALGPIYMPTWVPGAEVVSDENGCRFEFSEGDLQTCLNNIASGERFAPTVTCGPYRFVSFENKIVTLEKNEYFKCDYEGNVPQLQYIVQQTVSTETDVDQVLAGELDLMAKVVEGKKIEKAKADENISTHSYLRNGYGMIAMPVDFGPTKDVNVRWALACLIDRSAVIDYVLGGYGGTVDAEYGLAQWTYQEKAAELADELKPMTFNIDVANDYLDASDYKYESDGTTPFDRTKANADGSYMRYNSQGEMLVIEHLGTTDNDVTDVIEIQYLANAPLAGVKFNVTKGDFAVLLDNYYYGASMPAGERKYHTFNLASDFGNPDDKYYSSWHSDFAYNWQNPCNVADEELDRIIETMRGLDAEKTDEYAELWKQFVVRWQEILPNIPLYSNEYFDVFRNNVHGIEGITPFYDWYNIVCQISKS